MTFLKSAGSTSCGRKTKTFSNFLEFKALVEKDTGKHLKALRRNNGVDYISNEFKNFCSKEGIQRELIVPHNPPQNRVTERNNRTLVGATRPMLHDQGLPLHLWRRHATHWYLCKTVVLIGYLACVH